MLDRLAPVLGFAVDEVDIESDEALHRLYMLEIPVVMYEGREIARAPIRGHVLEDALREAMGR